MAGAAFNFGMVSVCALPTMLSCPMVMAGIVRQKTAVNIAVSIELLFPCVITMTITRLCWIYCMLGRCAQNYRKIGCENCLKIFCLIFL